MNKVELFINKSKLALSKAGKFIASTEGQATILAGLGCICLGVILAEKQDAKAMGITYGELMQKIRESK